MSVHRDRNDITKVGGDGRAPRWGGMALAFAALAGQLAPSAPPLWLNGWSCCPSAFGIRDAPSVLRGERSPTNSSWATTGFTRG